MKDYLNSEKDKLSAASFKTLSN